MNGFIAALDQSGKSVDNALSLYEVNYDMNSRQKKLDDFKMRVIKSKCFNSSKVFGVIISKDMIDGFMDYLSDKKVFVKIDEGLESQKDGVRLFKEIRNFDQIIDSLNGVYGTKVRSLILKDDEKGISTLVKQQFDLASKIYSKGLIPIIEPEISIHAENKINCEKLLKDELSKYSNCKFKYILKITLPEIDDYYKDLFNNENLLYLSYLSGGYSKDKAIEKLSKNRGIACFSRALLEGLKYEQNDYEFEDILSKNIDEIYYKKL
ncbi:MAG: class I fructose-bisphosphate aldolase [Bacilli bacterium]|nr:class I fructose-bisphosphate aldolase [Bacilli bacterium]